MHRYFVTKFGIAASLVDAKIHTEIKEAVGGTAPTLVQQRLVRDGYLALDQRQADGVDHNTLAVNGVLDQVRLVISSLQGNVAATKSHHQTAARNVPIPTPSFPGNKHHWGRTPVGYVSLPPKARMPALTPSARAIYEALRDTPQSAQELARKFRNYNPATVKWALQYLRQKGLAQSVPLTLSEAA